MKSFLEISRRSPGPFLRPVLWSCAWLLVSACAPATGGSLRAGGDSVQSPGPKVAVAVFEDDRPPGDRDPAPRIEEGDVLYPYYTYDTEKEPVSFRCGFLGSCTAFHRVTHRVPEEAADRLLRMGISNGIFSSESRVVSAPSDGSSGRLPALSEEGFEYLVTGKLVRLYGMAYQPVEPLSTILSWTLSGVTQAWLFGGPGNSPSPHQVHGLVSLEEIRITHLGKEEVLWEGPAEATIERTDSVTSPRQAADEALHGAIIKILNKFNELK